MKTIPFLIVLVLFSGNGTAQKTFPYRNLVMEGGGIRGFAYTGALEVLDSLGILKNLERVGGTSAGAIQATMLAVGYSTVEMVKLTEDLPLKQFNDGTIAGGLSRVQKKFGFYKGEKISQWIEQLIKAKTGNADITFEELHNLKMQKGYKDLYITGTDITYRCLRIFSYENYPSMRIKDALRISVSLPLYFEPVFINDTGKPVSSYDPSAHLMIDGGLLSNYPVGIFDSSRYFACEKTINCRNKETIGLLLETPEQLSFSLRKSLTPQIPVTLTEYVKAIYQTAIDRPNPDDENLRRTITISDLGIRSRVKKLSKKQIQQLIESGRNAGRSFFAGS
jgi:NTE family protein